MGELYIGLMSGTSADGVDAALVDFSSSARHGGHLLATMAHPYPPAVRDEILRISQSPGPIAPAALATLDQRIAQTFAQAALALCQTAGVNPAQVRAIGSHGQTLFHHPPSAGVAVPYTWQVGDPNRIAWDTGMTVVADFRRMDMAAGGQGAPLVPACHSAMFSSPGERRAVVNIGGIANLTLLPAQPDDIITGFDCGPGNGLMDAWIQRHNGQAWDNNGQWAASGQIDHALLARWLQDPYFHQPPPKSTGRDYFNLQRFAPPSDRAGSGIAPQHVQATLLALTAHAIADALQHWGHNPRRLLVCGGGAHNTRLMQMLAELLPTLPVESTRQHGMPPDWVEAACFAWLARQRLLGRPGNLPSVTGAAQPVQLGGVYCP